MIHTMMVLLMELNGLDASSVETYGIFAFVGCLIMMVGIVAVVYAAKGTMVIMRISLYILSLTTIKIGVRSVLSTHAFPYPKFLNTTHFLCSGLVAWAFLLLRSKCFDKPFQPISFSTFFYMVVPIASAFSLSACLNNEAIAVSGANFVEIGNTAGPLCTAFIAFFMDRPLPWAQYPPLFAVTIGLVICVTGDLQYSNIALILISLANLLRSMKAILQQFLVRRRGPVEGRVLEPTELLAWMSIPAVILAFSWSVTAEGMLPWERLQDEEGKWQRIMAILLTCVQASVLNVLSIWAVKDLGAVGAQLAGNLKGVVVLVGGVTVLGESVSVGQVIGYTIVLAAIVWFSHAEKADEKNTPQSAGPNEKTALLPRENEETAASNDKKFSRASSSSSLSVAIRGEPHISDRGDCKSLDSLA